MPFFARPVRGGLLAAAARTAVVAGTAQVVTGRIAARQRARADQAAGSVVPPAAPSLAPSPAPSPTAPPPAGADSAAEVLRQLGQLHDERVLSDDEFTAAKRRLLGMPESPTS